MNDNEMDNTKIPRNKIMQELESLRTQLDEFKSKENKHKELEQSLLEHRKRLNKAEELAHLGSWEMNIATGSGEWSDEFYRICGLEPNSVEPTAEEGMKLIHPEDRESAAKAVSESIASGKNYRMEKKILRPDGTIRHVISVGEILYDEQGQPERLMGSFLDVTNLKQAEKEREKLIEELRTALAEVKQLSGLLPICASCKNIRDDSGYWHEVEVYLCNHSDVDFTHGMCPTCMQKMYPDHIALLNDP
jgi:PAS domain S-box-containing protein